VLDYNDGRVVTSMVSPGLSLNMVFDVRDSPIHATRGYGFWRAAAFVNLLATSDPITGGFEKVYAVGVEGAKGLILGTGEAF
jgi:hypothetical protein